MDRSDRLLTIARWVLRAVVWLNWAFVACFVAALLLSLAFAPWLEARLVAKYGASLDVAQAVAALRILALIGLGACVAAWVIATRLLAMIATVAAGAPFSLANATRLAAIGWALLAVQLLDLALGAVAGWLAALHVQFATWTPSVGGWIAVLMVFILARIFAHGAAINDELEGTI